MAKKKKISFSYSLYKKAQPEKNIEGDFVYPVYIKITFNRTSTKFPLPEEVGNYGIVNSYSQKEFDESIKNKYFSEYESAYELIIRYEYANSSSPDGYSVVGIHKRYPHYLRGISLLLSQTIDGQLMNRLGDLLTFNEYVQIDMSIRESYDYYEFDLIELVMLPRVVFNFNWLFEKITDPSRLCTDKITFQFRLIFEFFLFEMFYGHECCHFDGGKLFLIDWYGRPNLKQGFAKFFNNGQRDSALVDLKNDKSLWATQLFFFAEKVNLLELNIEPLDIIKGVNSILDNYFQVNKKLDIGQFSFIPIVQDPFGLKNE